MRRVVIFVLLAFGVLVVEGCRAGKPCDCPRFSTEVAGG